MSSATVVSTTIIHHRCIIDHRRPRPTTITSCNVRGHSPELTLSSIFFELILFVFFLTDFVENIASKASSVTRPSTGGYGKSPEDYGSDPGRKPVDYGHAPTRSAEDYIVRLSSGRQHRLCKFVVVVLINCPMTRKVSPAECDKIIRETVSR